MDFALSFNVNKSRMSRKFQRNIIYIPKINTIHIASVVSYHIITTDFIISNVTQKSVISFWVKCYKLNFLIACLTAIK